MTTEKLKSNSKMNENLQSGNRNNDAVPISEDTVAAAGFNVENPIMNALIGNIKGTLPVKKSANANSVKCEICNCEMSSELVMSFHINGAKHKKKLKALEIVSQLKTSGEKGLELGKEDDPNAFRCEICSLTVNSAQQLEIHITGSKHKNKAAKAGLLPDLPTVNANANTNVDVNVSESNAVDGEPPAKKKKKEEVTLYCQTCQVTVNSQHQYDQHLLSKKHLNKSSPQKHTPNKLKGKPNMRFVNFKSGGKQIFNNMKPNPLNGTNNGASIPPLGNFNNAGNFLKPGNFEPPGNFNNPGNFKKPRDFLKPDNFNKQGQGNFNFQEKFKNPANPMNKPGNFNRPAPQTPGNFKKPRDSSVPGDFKNPGNFQPPPLMNLNNNHFNDLGNFNNFNNNPVNNNKRPSFNGQNHERMGPPKKKFNGPGQNNNNNSNNNFRKNMQNGVQRMKTPGKNQQFRNNRGNNQFTPFSKGDMLPPPPPPPSLF